MLKKILVTLFVAILMSGICCLNNDKNSKKVSEEIKYKDGEYTGESRSVYTFENYWGVTTVDIKSGKILSVDFKIIDRNKNEEFGDKYERHFSGNQVYIEQCRNDWKGVQTYPGLFLEKQDINSVDSITGATWSYNIFRDSLLNALEKAK